MSAEKFTLTLLCPYVNITEYLHKVDKQPAANLVFQASMPEWGGLIHAADFFWKGIPSHMQFISSFPKLVFNCFTLTHRIMSPESLKSPNICTMFKIKIRPALSFSTETTLCVVLMVLVLMQLSAWPSAQVIRSSCTSDMGSSWSLVCVVTYSVTSVTSHV